MRIYFVLLLLTLVSCKDSTLECNDIKQRLHYSLEADDSITVKLFWIAKFYPNNYIPQYRIDSVIHTEYNKLSYYYNKDVNIEWLNEDLKRQFNNLGDSKSTATYILSGNIRSNGFGILRFDVVSGEIFNVENK